MKTTNYTLAICLSALICFSGCQKNTTTDEIVIADEVFEGDGHNAQNSLDYYGTYQGVLPCADCEGVKTTIELGPGDSFVKKTTYLGKGDDTVHEANGMFTWNEAGNTITLANLDTPNQYFVGEGVLFHLDIDGNRITGELEDHYKLIKE